MSLKHDGDTPDPIQGIPALGTDGGTLRPVVVDSLGKLVISNPGGGGPGGDTAIATIRDVDGVTDFEAGDKTTSALRVNVVAGAGGGVSATDKAAFVEGTGIGTPAMGVVNDTLGGDVSEDAVGVIRMTPKRSLHVNLRAVDGTALPGGTAASPFRVDPTGSTTQPVSGTVAVSGVGGVVHVDDNAGTISVDDGNSSLTVDGTVAISGTVAVTDNSGSLSVDDGAGSLTVDGTVTANLGTLNGAATEATLSAINTKLPADPATDRDTAAAPFAVRLSNGASFIAALPITDNGGSLTVDGTVAVSGSVAVTDNGGSLTVDGSVTVADGGGSLTVDGTVAVSGVSGVVHIDDNSGTLTVDGTVAATQSGTWNVRNQDGSGNALESGTANPATNARGLTVRALDAAMRSSVTTAVNAVLFDTAAEAYASNAIDTTNYKNFTLYLAWTKAGTGTAPNVKVQVEFTPDSGSTWFLLNEMPFGDLRMSVDAIGSGLNEVLHGPCVGASMRINCISASCDGTNKITLTAKVELYS